MAGEIPGTAGSPPSGDLTWMRLEVLPPLTNAVVTSKLSVVHPF